MTVHYFQQFPPSIKILIQKKEIKDKIINFKKITPPVNPGAQGTWGKNSHLRG
jgi:hypothetical protein